VYLDWAIEAIPPDILINCLPAEIHIAYRAEAVYGGKILSRSAAIGSPDSGVFLHQLISAGEGREVTRLMTTWRDRDSF
jgi:medium-chain acyl-[acyl-carrier-protein] hydrolase